MESMTNRYHSHELAPNQCVSSVTQTIHAPISLVWSLIRQFDNPQAYKRFIKNCSISDGNGGIGSLRMVQLVSGFPAKTRIERLDELDDDSHVMIFSVVGGDCRLNNYRSTTTVHEVDDDHDYQHNGIGKTAVVIESYVADVPTGNTEEETCLFADNLIRLNLRSLASIAEKTASVTNTSTTTLLHNAACCVM